MNYFTAEQRLDLDGFVIACGEVNALKLAKFLARRKLKTVYVYGPYFYNSDPLAECQHDDYGISLEKDGDRLYCRVNHLGHVLDPYENKIILEG